MKSGAGFLFTLATSGRLKPANTLSILDLNFITVCGDTYLLKLLYMYVFKPICTFYVRIMEHL
ncbi:MAG: hypothetical protein JSU07_04350 [Bacteroidetes bacterium]|nr:hypothetical protein [Bacteroidota bacterium]